MFKVVAMVCQVVAGSVTTNCINGESVDSYPDRPSCEAMVPEYEARIRNNAAEVGVEIALILTCKVVDNPA